jgi:hypothetical protein
VEESPCEAQAMHHSGRESADLAIEIITNAHPAGHLDNSVACDGAGDVVHRGKERQIFPGCEPAVKSFVPSGVISELLSRASAIEFDIEAAESCPAARRNNEGGEYAKKSGLSGAVGADQCDGFAGIYRERYSRESSLRRTRNRLQQSSPSGEGRREIFFEGIDRDGRGTCHASRYTGFDGANPVPSQKQLGD